VEKNFFNKNENSYWNILKFYFCRETRIFLKYFCNILKINAKRRNLKHHSVDY